MQSDSENEPQVKDDNVVNLDEHRKAVPFEPPRHFRGTQKVAWADLTEHAPAALKTARNRVTFEIAATLLARFRKGIALNATEHKELKRQLVALGLASADAGPEKPKSKNAAKYFGP